MSIENKKVNDHDKTDLIFLEELYEKSKKNEDNYFAKMREKALNGKFIIANTYASTNDGGTLYYSPKGEDNVNIFGYEYAKNWPETLPEALIVLFYNAFLHPNTVCVFATSDGTISVIDKQIYITDHELMDSEIGYDKDFIEIIYNRNSIIENAKIVDASLLDCARQLIKYIDKNNRVGRWRDQITIFIYYEALCILVKAQETQLSNDEKEIFERNRLWIKNRIIKMKNNRIKVPVEERAACHTQYLW